MEDTAVAILQQVLAGLNVTGQPLQTNGTSLPDHASPLPAAVAAIMPANLSAILTFLFSFSALKDWLKLFLIGGIFETCRRSATSCYHYLMSCFFINAYFEEDDASYEWMMVWLTRHTPMKQARNIEVSTKTFGINSPAVSYDSDDEVSPRDRKISFLPSMSTSFSLWYKWRRVTVTRTERQKGYYGRTEETLAVRMLSWSQEPLIQLLQEAKREYLAAQVNTIGIYYADTANNWRLACNRPKRPLNSIVLDPGVKDLILDDAKDFLESRSWYEARGIPFRRGYLLWGAPGSGKTSVIHALAGELGLDVYVISLSRFGLDDTTLSELISSLPEKCIALMEDIDAAFHHGLSRETPSPSQPTQGGETPTPVPGNPPAPPPTLSARVTLSGLLNALDGVGAQEGRILFATTNKYLSLDPALCRPGRMDVHVEFMLASKYQAKELFRRFYLPDERPKESGVVDVLADQKLEKISLDSGYSSTENLVDLADSPSSDSSGAERQFQSLAHRTRAALFTPTQVDTLAEQFSDAIPDRDISMASLQGYLMTYKGHPEKAVANVAAWVLKEKHDRAKRTQMLSGSVAVDQATPKAEET